MENKFKMIYVPVVYRDEFVVMPSYLISKIEYHRKNKISVKYEIVYSKRIYNMAEEKYPKYCDNSLSCRNSNLVDTIYEDYNVAKKVVDELNSNRINEEIGERVSIDINDFFIKYIAMPFTQNKEFAGYVPMPIYYIGQKFFYKNDSVIIKEEVVPVRKSYDFNAEVKPKYTSDTSACSNSTLVDVVYDSYEEANKVATALNNEYNGLIAEKLFCTGNSTFIYDLYNIQEEAEKFIASLYKPNEKSKEN